MDSKHQVKIAFLKLCKGLGLFWVAARINRRKLCILCYHGLALNGESGFGPMLFMERNTFAARIEHLKRSRRPILSLSEAVKRLRSGSLPDNTVVITIDDGFYSTYFYAAPILKAYGFPATVYVTTYYTKSSEPIYRLFVRYAFWKTRATRLRESEVVSEFDGEVDLADGRQVSRSIQRFAEYGEARSIDDQVKISKRLGSALEVSYEELQASRLLTLMTPEEIVKLCDYGIDIQLHTHRHQMPLDRENVIREIQDNRDLLAPLCNHSLEHLCYPSGEWSPRHWPWLNEAGIVTATTCDYGLNDAATNRLALKRFLDGEDVSLVEFDAAVSGFAEWLQPVKEALHSVKKTIRRRPQIVALLDYFGFSGRGNIEFH